MARFLESIDYELGLSYDDANDVFIGYAELYFIDTEGDSDSFVISGANLRRLIEEIDEAGCQLASIEDRVKIAMPSKE